MRLITGAVVGFLGLAIATDLNAGPLALSSRAAFETATYGRSTIEFEGIAPPNDLVTKYPAFHQSGVTFRGVFADGTGTQPSDLLVVDPGFFPDLFDWGSGAILVAVPPMEGSDFRLEVILPPGTTAFGTDLMTLQPDGLPVTITLADGTTFAAATHGFPDRAFLGVIADTPIASVSFATDPTAYPALDNFAFGHAAPLPPSAVLFCVGSGALAIRRLSRRG